MFFIMRNTPENLLKEYIKSQKFSSTAQIMGAMKDIFKDVFEQVMECELEQNLGFEKSQRVSDYDDSCMPKNYRNGNYTPQISRLRMA